jgi:DNA-directed RNA polymerase subunit omega
LLNGPRRTIVAAVIFRSFVQPRSRSAADKEKKQTLDGLAYMNHILLKSASAVVPNDQLLVNMVRQRVRQLTRGHRPLVATAPGLGLLDVALSEISAGKLTYELVPGIKPDNSFTPMLSFHGVNSDKKAA